MKKTFKFITCLLLIVALFSCKTFVKEEVSASVTPTSEITTSETLQSLSTTVEKEQTDDEKEIDRKYKALNLKYSDKRENFASDVIFANFRNVKIGNIKEGILYRGASPIDNLRGRAKYACKLMEDVGIKFDVNLNDSDEGVKKHFSQKDFASPYYKTLYESGKVVCLHMGTNYREQKYHDRIVKAMVAMSKNEGPYYIHCVEGKNRTGFLLAVIEGLAGASYDEMVKDHMTTFANYYGITEETDKEKYDIIKARYIDSVLRYIADNDPWTGNGTIELRDLDWVNVMGRYLERNGMSQEDIENWYKNVTTENYSDPG